MNPLKMLRLAAVLLVVFALAFACSDSHYRASAQPDDRVVVDPAVDDANSIENRIESRLREDDEIHVVIMPEGDQTVPESNGVVFLYAEGKQVTVIGNDWVPQVWLDERLDRIDNVTRRPVDQIVRMIDEIHQWQAENPRPTPPPPPPGPPAPPPPPPEPLVINWVVVGPVVFFGLLSAFLSVQAIRRRIKRKEIARRAEEQADWGLDKYGIKTSLD